VRQPRDADAGCLSQLLLQHLVLLGRLVGAEPKRQLFDGGAVRRLMTNSNFVGCSTGSSLCFAPFRILSTYAADALAMVARFDPMLAR